VYRLYLLHAIAICFIGVSSRELPRRNTALCHAAFNRIYGATYHKWRINDNEISVASRLLTNSVYGVDESRIFDDVFIDTTFNLFDVHGND